jgi:hypothetical protein
LSHPACPRQDRQPGRCGEMGAQQHRAALGTLSLRGAASPFAAGAGGTVHPVCVSASAFRSCSGFPRFWRSHFDCWRCSRACWRHCSRAGCSAPPWWLVDPSCLHAAGGRGARAGIAGLALAARLPCAGAGVWRTDRSQVPLYLSSRQVPRSRLLHLLPDQPIAGCSTSAAATARCCAIWPATARTVALSACRACTAALALGTAGGASLPNLEDPSLGDFWTPFAGRITTWSMPFSRRLRCRACGSRPVGRCALARKTGQQQFSVPGCQRGGPNRGCRQVAMTYFYVYRPAGTRSRIDRAMTPGSAHAMDQPGIGMRFAI